MNNTKRKFTILIDKTIGEVIFFIIRLISKIKARKSRENETTDNKKIRKILVIRPGGIGDYLLSIAFFRRLERTFPNAKITLFCFKRNYISTSIFKNFDNIIVIDKIKNFLKFLIDRKEYDITFDLDQKRKLSSVISYLSKSPIRVGFDTGNRRDLYTHIIQYSHDTYEASMILKQLSYFTDNIEFKENDLLIKINSSDSINLINRFVKEKNYKRKIGIYASALKKENRLPIDKWKTIISNNSINSTFFFIGSKEDKKRLDELERLLENFDIVRTDGKLSLSEVTILINGLDLLISEDGGILHTASITNTKSLSFWGPTIMEKWKHPSNIHIGIKSNLPCAPCTYGNFAEFPGCPYNLKCLKDIKIEQ